MEAENNTREVLRQELSSDILETGFPSQNRIFGLLSASCRNLSGVNALCGGEATTVFSCWPFTILIFLNFRIFSRLGIEAICVGKEIEIYCSDVCWHQRHCHRSENKHVQKPNHTRFFGVSWAWVCSHSSNDTFGPCESWQTFQKAQLMV